MDVTPPKPPPLPQNNQKNTKNIHKEQNIQKNTKNIHDDQPKPKNKNKNLKKKLKKIQKKKMEELEEIGRNGMMCGNGAVDQIRAKVYNTIVVLSGSLILDRQDEEWHVDVYGHRLTCDGFMRKETTGEREARKEKYRIPEPCVFAYQYEHPREISVYGHILEIGTSDIATGHIDDGDSDESLDHYFATERWRRGKASKLEHKKEVRLKRKRITQKKMEKRFQPALYEENTGYSTERGVFSADDETMSDETETDDDVTEAEVLGGYEMDDVYFIRDMFTALNQSVQEDDYIFVSRMLVSHFRDRVDFQDWQDWAETRDDHDWSLFIESVPRYYNFGDTFNVIPNLAHPAHDMAVLTEEIIEQFDLPSIECLIPRSVTNLDYPTMTVNTHHLMVSFLLKEKFILDNNDPIGTFQTLREDFDDWRDAESFYYFIMARCTHRLTRMTPAAKVDVIRKRKEQAVASLARQYLYDKDDTCLVMALDELEDRGLCIPITDIKRKMDELKKVESEKQQDITRGFAEMLRKSKDREAMVTIIDEHNATTPNKVSIEEVEEMVKIMETNENPATAPETAWEAHESKLPDADPEDYRRLVEVLKKVKPTAEELQKATAHLPVWLKMHSSKGISLCLQLITQAIHMATLTTFDQVVTALIAMVAQFAGDKIVSSLTTWIRKLCGESKMEPALSIADMLSSVRSKSHLSNLVKLVGMCITICFTGFANFKFDFDLFQDATWSMGDPVKATSIVEIFDHSLSWFYETGQKVFTSGSLAPLFYSDQRTSELVTAHDELTDKTSKMSVGALRVDPTEIISMSAACEKWAARCVDILKTLSDKSVRLFVSKLQYDFKQMQSTCQARLRSVKMRRSPYFPVIYGEPGVGKTTVRELIQVAYAQAIGQTFSNTDVSFIKAGASFDDTTLSTTKVVVADDIAQDKPEKTTENPLRHVIDIGNNTPSMIHKADLAEKGQHFYSPEMLIATTNKIHMNASQYAATPGAILRRPNVYITVTVKDDYRSPFGTLDSTKCDGNGMDYWWFKLERYDLDTGSFVQAELPEGMTEQPVGGKVGITGLLQYIRLTGKKFYDDQVRVVSEMAHFKIVDDKVVTGPAGFVVDTIYSTILQGASEVVSKTVGAVLPWNWKRLFKSTMKDVRREAVKITVDVVEDRAKGVIDWIPKQWWKTDDGKPSWLLKALQRWERSRVKRSGTYRNMMLALCAFSAVSTIVLPPTAALLWPTAGILHMVFNHALRNDAIHQKVEELQALSPSKIMTMQRKTEWTTAIAVGGATFLCGVAVYLAWSRSAQITASLDTVEKEEISWFDCFFKSKKVVMPEKPMVASELQKTIRKNMVNVSFTPPSCETRRMRGVMVKKHYLITCKHLFTNTKVMKGDIMTGNFEVSSRRKNADKAANNVSFPLDSSHVVQIGDKDLVLVYIPYCFDAVDRTAVFPSSSTEVSFHGKLMSMDQEYHVHEQNVYATYKTVGYDGAHCKGFSAKPDTIHAHKGQCGSLLLSEVGKRSCIQGIMFASDTECTEAHYIPLSKTEIETAMAKFDKTNQIEAALLTDIVGKEHFGQPFVTSENLHEKSYFKNVSSKVVVPLGTIKQRHTPGSKVRPRPLAPAMEKVFDMQSTHGPPKIRGIDKDGNKYGPARAFNAAAEHLCAGAGLMRGDLLEKAKEDYKKELMPLVKDWAKRDKTMRVLTDDEMLNGIRGVKYMEKVNMATSMGFPMGGPKSKHFTQNDEGWKMNENVANEFSRVQALLDSGSRTYPVFRTNLKDELIPLEKDKARPFYACNVVNTLMMRKYFLGIARFLQKHKRKSEMAIGANPLSADWDHLMDHAKGFMGSDKQLIAFDFSKYDLKFMPNVLRCAYDILIEMAQEAGYAEEDIAKMKILKADAVNPLVDWYGTLLSTIGLHPSGNPLTVVVNSIVNCLLFRCYFYSMNVGDDFRSVVKYMSYGDDGIGSVVCTHTKNINFLGYQQFLSEYGMKITHPSKADNMDFSEDELDFLKRKSVWNEALGMNMGALCKESIFKSLFDGIPPKQFSSNGEFTGNDDFSACSDVIDSALHEFYAHGRHEYEEFRTKIKEVARLSKVTNEAINLSYDDRTQLFRSKFADGPLMDDKNRT